LNQAELHILEILERKHPEEMYGVDILRASTRELNRGNLYVHLTRLEDQGLILGRTERLIKPLPGQIARRLYSLTSTGTQALRDARTQPAARHS